jgi:hypothetical protein
MVATRALFEGDHELSPMLCLGFGRNLPESELVVLPLSFVEFDPTRTWAG